MANEEIGNLVVKIGMDGTGFQNGVSNLNRQMAVVKSEFQAASAKLGEFGNSTDGLKLKSDQLTKLIEIQSQKVTALGNAFNKSADLKGRDAKATQDLEIKLNKARAALATMENDLKTTNTHINQQSTVFKKLGDTVASSSERIKSSMSGIGAAIKNSLVFTLVYEGLHKVKDGFDAVVGGGIRFNASMETNTIAFTQMLGSAEKAKVMLQDLTQFAAQTPFELPQVEDLAKKLLAFGFAGKDIIPMLTKIGDAAAGLGLGAEGANRLAIAIGQIQAKGKVQSDELLQLTEAGVPALQILAQSFGVSTAQMQEMVTKGAVPADKAIQALLDGMEQRFPKMMDAQSKSFSGLMSNLSDNLNQTFGTVMKPVFEWLTTTALPKAVQLTTDFTKALKEGGAVQAFKTILPPNVVDGFVSFGNAVKDVFGFIKANWQAITAAFIGIGSGLAVFKGYNAILATVEAIKALRIAMMALTASNPILLAISVVIGLIAAAAFLIIDNWTQISQFFGDLWNSVTETFAKWGEAISTWVTVDIPQIINNIIQFFAELPAKIGAFFTDVLKTIGQWGIDAINWVITEVPKIIENVFTFFSELPGKIGYALGVAIGTLVKWGIDAVKWVITEVPKIIQGIITFFAELPGKIGEWLLSVIDGIKKWGANIGSWIATEVPKFINGIVNFFSELPGKIANFLGNALKSVVGWVANLIQTAKTEIPKFITGVVDFFLELPGKMLDIGKNIILGLWNGIGNMVGWIKDKIAEFAGGIIDGIKDVLGINSPSRVTMEIGQYTGQGLAIGMGNTIGDISKQADVMANAAIPNIGRTSVNGVNTSGASSSTTTNSFEGMFSGAIFNVRSDNDIKSIAQELYYLTQKTSRRSGVAF